MLKIGYSEADITPENGEDLCGFTLRTKGSHGIHDRLKVKWLSLADSSGKTWMLGAADIISVSRNTFGELQSAITGAVQSPVAGVGFATSHTHSGPVTVTLRNCGKLNKSYMATLKQQITQTAIAAAGERPRQVKVRLGFSTSDEGINRRQGKRGPIDREVTAVSFVDARSGKIRATIAHFACHPVVLGHINNFVSADYPGYLQQHVEKATGAPCLFLNGACGDINPRLGNHSDNPEDAKRIGFSIGASVMEALNGAAEIAVEQIGWYTRTVQLPVYKPTPRELEDRLDMIHSTFGLPRDLFADRVARDKKLLKEGRYPGTVGLELALMTLDPDLAILFVPGELFSSIGLKMKQIFAPRKLLVSGFSNGSVGYLPDRQAYADGGYEPFFANFFYDFPQFDPSVEDVLVEGTTVLARLAQRSETMKCA